MLRVKILVLFLAIISVTLAATQDDRDSVKQSRKRSSSSSSAKFLAKNARDMTKSKGNVSIGSSISEVGSEKRQYSSTYGYGSGGGYDIYTLIAVSAFAALFGALFFELATGGTLRSMDSSTGIQLPFGFYLDSNIVSQLMSKVGEAISSLDSKFFDDVMTEIEKSTSAKGGAGSKSRVLRDLGRHIGISKWIDAYKRDPVEYQCVRKVACETLADSTIVAKSMKSPFGGIVLSTVGSFMEHGHELRAIVKDTIGNPDKCKDMAPWGFCTDDDDEEK